MRAPSHTTIAAYAALLVALSGSAYAAAQITSADIKDNSVKSADVRNKTLALNDISPKARKSLRGALELPPFSVVVSSKGDPAKNGATLVAALAALPTATATRPRTVVLGPGHYALTTANGSFQVPTYVTVVGQGPLTVLENTSTSSFLSVVRLGDHAVLRSVSILNAGTSSGGGVDAGTSSGTVVDDVAVSARTGVTVRASVVRDVTIEAKTDGLRVLAPAVATDVTQLDNVTISVSGASSAIGMTIAGPALVDGVDVEADSNGTTQGLLVSSVTGPVEVRDSSFVARFGGTAAYGVNLDATGAPTANAYFDHVRMTGGLTGGGLNSYGLRTSGDGLTGRVGSSVVGGASSDVFEAQVADARCIDSHDESYTVDVDC